MGLPEARVRAKQAELLADFGRRAVFERDLPAARRYLLRSLRLRPDIRTAAHLGISMAPAAALEARRKAVALLRPRELGVDEAADRAAMILRDPSRPIATPPELARPRLLVTVDAEEDFDWSRPFSRAATDVTSMRSQHVAHRLFERHGVVPTYMVDYPVASQDAGRAPLRELLASGLCGIGAQLHPWVTPPFDEAVSFHNSYQGNLPVDVERAKIAALTDEIARAFGAPPRIFRAGRYGVGPNTGAILREARYEADSSVVPCWGFGEQGGRITGR